MIYLDNAATSFPKPEAVYQALDAFARRDLANPGRAGHKMALAAERALDDGRHELNQLFHGEAPERFVFTLNCTDALNMAFKGVLADGDHVVTSDLEHNSVSRPLRAMELAGKITLERRQGRAGGTGGDSSSETQPRELPNFLEGGTPNVLGIAGLTAGIKHVREQGLEKIHKHETDLVERLWRRLDEIGGIEVFGHRDMSKRVGTLSFRSEAWPAAELGGILDQA